MRRCPVLFSFFLTALMMSSFPILAEVPTETLEKRVSSFLMIGDPYNAFLEVDAALKKDPESIALQKMYLKHLGTDRLE